MDQERKKCNSKLQIEEELFQSSSQSWSSKNTQGDSLDDVFDDLEDWPEGELYEGEKSGNMKQGAGRLKFRDANSASSYIYVGEFDHDKKHGRGVQTWSNGRQYKGQFSEDRVDGEGIMLWPDGSRYVGQYVEGKKDGVGTFIWPDGRQYDGHWRADEKRGSGVFSNGKVGFLESVEVSFSTLENMLGAPPFTRRSMVGGNIYADASLPDDDTVTNVGIGNVSLDGSLGDCLAFHNNINTVSIGDDSLDGSLGSLGTINDGIDVSGKFQCPRCRQKYGDQKSLDMHFIDHVFGQPS